MTDETNLSRGIDAIRVEDQLELLAGVVGGSAASISIADASLPGLPLVYVNEAFEILSGYGRAEVLGQNCRFLSAEPADSPERIRLREAVEHRRPGVFELRNRRADGVIFWNRLSLYPLYVANGARCYLVATQEDMTGVREANEDRDAARGQLLSALAGTREGFLLLNGDGVIQTTNARYREFFETNPEQWKAGRHFTAAWTDRLTATGTAKQSAAHLSDQRFDQILKGAKNVELQLPDGRIVVVNDTVVPGTGFVSVVTDVTSIRATERRLAERMVAIDTAQDGIAIADGAGRFVYLNPSHVTMFGYSAPMDLIGQSWEKLYRPEQIRYLQQNAMLAVTQTGKWRGDIIGIRRDGSEILQDVSLTRLDGVGLICVTRDISDRVRGEVERTRLREQLARAQRQEAIGQMAAGIAHDFNNVLAVINGSARLLEEDMPASAGAHIRRIISAGVQAQQLVAKILDYGARNSQRVLQDMRAPFLDAITLVRSGLPPEIEAVVYQPSDPLFAEIDSTDLMQVVLNLALNARDAIDGKGQITVSLEPVASPRHETPPALGHIDPDGHYARLIIADTGNGIAPGDLGHIFQPYHSTKGADGTGLGLSVVASTVAGAGGALFVSSTLGEGTQFEILWPVTTAPEGADTKAPSTGPTEDLGALKVIILDDEAPVAETMAEDLERRGAEVAICTDPRDALEAVAEDPDFWDVIVTDFDMPVMNGADLARRVQDIAPEIPIILCTALPDWGGRGKAAANLFKEVLQKPVDADTLSAVVAGGATRTT